MLFPWLSGPSWCLFKDCCPPRRLWGRASLGKGLRPDLKGRELYLPWEPSYLRSYTVWRIQLTGLASGSKGHDSRLVSEETLSVDVLCCMQGWGSRPSSWLMCCDLFSWWHWVPRLSLSIQTWGCPQTVLTLYSLLTSWLEFFFKSIITFTF